MYIYIIYYIIYYIYTELDYSCCRGPDPVGDKSGRGSFSCLEPFWSSCQRGEGSLGFFEFEEELFSSAESLLSAPRAGLRQVGGRAEMSLWGRGKGSERIFRGVENYIDFSYESLSKMGSFWRPFLAYFFDFWCSAQWALFFIPYGVVFVSPLRGKSRCFVRDIL